MKHNSLRDRFADDVHEQIKIVALEQLAAGGPAALSINAIGRELEVSGPALYRYFRGRDELLTALILDAYAELTAVVEAAVAARRTPRTRLTAFVTAYRRWAVAEPSRYRLLLREPLPGYDPNAAELVTASQGAMNVLISAADGLDPGRGTDDLVGLRRWLTARGLPTSALGAARVAMLVMPRLHGLVSLEIEGVFGSMAIDPGPAYALERLVPELRRAGP